MPSAGDLYYEPSAEEVSSTVVDQVRLFINKECQVDLADVWDLYRFSLERANDYFTQISRFCGLIIDFDHSKPLFDNSSPMNKTRHLINARLNWAENMLCASPNSRSKIQKAIIACSEDDFTIQLTYEDLYQQVRLAAEGLRLLGVKEGDRVACFSPNNAEAIILLLATAAIGAIYVSCATELGVQAVLERLEQVEPVLLMTADKYKYNAKIIDVTPKSTAIIERLAAKGLRHVIFVGQTAEDRRPTPYTGAKPDLVELMTWPDFLASGQSAAAEIDFNRGDAMRPVFVLSSSGTTGKPKIIVHTAGGNLLQAASANITSYDARSTDVYLQQTTVSWMMWQYQVTHLLVGLTLVLWEGAPLTPQGRMWDIIDRHKVSMFNTSPRFLQILLDAQYSPKQHYSLKALRTLGMIGSPASSELYDFIRDHIKSGLFINNGSGGTDICGKFVGACRALPIRYAEIQMPIMGCRMEVWNDAGDKLPAGKEGHLVCAAAIPNLPLEFWHDTNRTKYNSAYFEAFSNKVAWNQSDWVVQTANGGFIMHGRSDGVLNPSGVRFGSAELYAVTENIQAVEDCIAIGQKIGVDERVIMFIKIKPDHEWSESLSKEIKTAIKNALSPRHIPALIIPAPDLPYTTNGKRCEVAIKKVVNGTDIKDVNTSAMANPDCLKWFVQRPELAL